MSLFPRKQQLNKNRKCGSCQACCTHFAIPEFEKEQGEKCEHQCGGGCAIHDDKPKRCDDFKCLWLQGAWANADRPDKIGVFLTPIMQQRLGVFILARGTPNIRGRRLIEFLSRKDAVIVVPNDPKADRRLVCADKKKAEELRRYLPTLLKYGV